MNCILPTSRGGQFFWSLIVTAHLYVCCFSFVAGVGRRNCLLSGTTIPFEALLTRLTTHVLTRSLEG